MYIRLLVNGLAVRERPRRLNVSMNDRGVAIVLLVPTLASSQIGLNALEDPAAVSILVNVVDGLCWLTYTGVLHCLRNVSS